MDGRKQKPLSSLYGPAVKKKASACAQASDMEDNPSIASLKRHPPPPRRLPAHIAAAGRAAGRDKSSSSKQSATPVEEEIDDGQEEPDIEEEEEIENEEEEYIYEPDQNDEHDGNSYDHDDDMSEEGGEDQPSIDISSGEDEARVEGTKKKKEGNKCSREFSRLEIFREGKCKKLNAKIASQLVQSRLGFKPVNGDANIPESATPGHVGFDQAVVKELIARMIMVHEYSFRMVEHEWFNIVLKYLNPLYTSMGRKAIRAECMRVYKKEKEKLKIALQEVDYISLTTDLWTSNQTIAYMCVVAHYIDADWKMQTRVLAFMELDPPHSGHVIADAIWDCVTDWKIENKMIATGKPYREALKDYAKSDLNYKWEPTSEEWKMYELIEPLLYVFAQVTTAFSAQSYPTANIFYRHIVSIKIELRKANAHRNPLYSAMGEAMMENFNKYWEEKNNVMVLATILDPRYKMFYVEWAFKELYDKNTALDELADVHLELEELFDKFDTAKKMAEKSATSSNICITSRSMPASDSAFQAHRRNTTTKSSKSELRNYLEDALEEPNPKFILLDWWKVNSLRYPVLAKMARRFLTIPASSVSSESTFSTGGRVLDDYRSSLKPAMVEALVCGASYIKGSHSDLNVMDKEDDDEENVETVKLPKSATNINYWNLN
ncbi:hypothetical protein ACQ4PT_007801 [Festuca glaucescens]